ncbi:MAG: SLBB domain-containing protein, partial [Nitrospirota bacterium]|nr:SLBB domain-containing protein [Nitrospirota bacterium]
KDDILKITVYDNPDLDTTARISSNGVINFPLIGNINVAGMTVSQISRKMSDLLADGYIVNPHVAVFIEEFRSKKTVIMGQIKNPGIYELHGETTFLEFLSKAGGLTKEAGDKAIIKRRPGQAGGDGNRIVIDLKKLIEDGDTSLDTPIMDGDNIYIGKAGLLYVTGEVKKPDAYRYEPGSTVIKSITKAGGFTDIASRGRVKILRKTEGKEEVIKRAKMDEPVLPDDIIIVPESFF